MQYETRRQARLRLERDRREALRRRLWAYVRTVVALAIFAAVAIFIGTRDQSGELTLLGPSSPEHVKDDKNTEQSSQKTTNLGEQITAALPGQIDSINRNLQISQQTGLADLPNHTAVAVATIDVSGHNRGNVSYNATTQFTSASTYKIFVAYAMIKDVESGRRTWHSSLNSTTWETCLNRMIINSDNACPEAYIALTNYNSFNQRIHDELGVSQATQLKPYDLRTTAADLAMVLQKLYAGQLTNEDNKNRLLSLMEQQIYRQGIPTGLGDGAKVADKVGFLDSLLHDAGIVHSDKGDYVMVIMTNGESWPFIAQLANYIHGVYNQ